MSNEIPPITSEMGKSWKQPDPKRILIDDTHAVMSQRDFDQLAEYSATMPSGVYDGKMWKRHDGLFDRSCAPQDRRWLLVWFGTSEHPDKSSVNFREMIVIPNEECGLINRRAA